MATTSGPYSGTINFGEVLPTGAMGPSGATSSGLPVSASDKVYLMSSMNSAEQQLMLLKLKQQQLVKLQQHKHKLEQQLADHVTHVGPKQKVSFLFTVSFIPPGLLQPHVHQRMKYPKY